MGNNISQLTFEFDPERLSDDEYRRSIIRFILSSEDFVEDLFDDKPAFVSRKRRKSCSNFGETTWGKMLQDPSTADPYSFWGKKFRRRFRVPFLFFKNILVPLCDDGNVFELKQENILIPIEIIIMVALRILGRDEVADTISELSDVGESTCLSIFNMFVKNFSRLYYDQYVAFPEGKFFDYCTYCF